jgi:ribosomal protein S13
MKKEFSTYSIIPTEVMLSEKISSTAKIVYGIISSLTNEKGYCWASNKYIGDLLKLSESQVSRVISELVEQELIISDIECNYKRKIQLMIKIGGYAKTARGVRKNSKGGTQKQQDNNIKEYYNNNIDTAKQSFADTVEPLIEPSVEPIEHSKEIQEILNLFYEINPTLNFGNKTQRKAAEDLINKFGFEKTINTVKFSNSIQGKRYAPTITTPLELKNNLSKLMIYYKREQEPDKGVVPDFQF